MTANQSDTQHRTDKVHPALKLAVPVEPIAVDGYYDDQTQTWSDRKYADAGSKKHNEQM
jgi:hypothetical protein